jgi:mono/diheme cytochrome c family protein
VGVPLSFGVSMGVKKGNRVLKEQLDAAIDRRQREIRSILDEYGIPLTPAGDSAPSGSRAPQHNSQPSPTPEAPSQPTPEAAAAPAASAPFRKLNPFTGNADMIAVGKSLYFQVGCQGCHGGGGGGGMAASVIDDSWKFGSDDEAVYKLIKGQIPEQTMPVVYSTLPDEQVWQLLAFIRSLYKGDPAKINW